MEWEASEHLRVLQALSRGRRALRQLASGLAASSWMAISTGLAISIGLTTVACAEPNAEPQQGKLRNAADPGSAHSRLAAPRRLWLDDGGDDGPGGGAEGGCGDENRRIWLCAVGEIWVAKCAVAPARSWEEYSPDNRQYAAFRWDLRSSATGAQAPRSYFLQHAGIGQAPSAGPGDVSGQHLAFDAAVAALTTATEAPLADRGCAPFTTNADTPDYDFVSTRSITVAKHFEALAAAKRLKQWRAQRRNASAGDEAAAGGQPAPVVDTDAELNARNHYRQLAICAEGYGPTDEVYPKFSKRNDRIAKQLLEGPLRQELKAEDAER